MARSATNSRPQLIYKCSIDKLCSTNLVTGAQSLYSVPSCRQFQWGCVWSELPSGSLLVSGPSNEAFKIETLREFADTNQARMTTSRRNHCTVYHAQHLYVLGGQSNRTSLTACERYVCAESRWEPVPPLLRAAHSQSGVVVESSLYALGGYDEVYSDCIQKLSLEGMTWELVQMRLPHPDCGIPCFKLGDTQVYFLLNKTLYSFLPQTLHIEAVKTFPEGIKCYRGPTHYYGGTLYCSSGEGPHRTLKIGDLS